MNLFVTGGAGFIGSSFIHTWLARYPESGLINFDKLTYAGNLANLTDVERCAGYRFVHGDICDRDALDAAIPEACDAVVHFAAESHVDRSITGSIEFIQTNVVGTQVLLDAARAKHAARFLHISTDEVGGSMQPDEWFREDSKLDPRSPYSASKAAAEHLVRAAGATFGIDYTITRTSNNYGPRQFPEKLLPLAICNAMEDRPIPVYGDGMQIRDWIHVTDNCEALIEVLLHGHAGETYHIGGGSPRPNKEVLLLLLEIMGKSPDLLTTVRDRLGHDRRYQVDFSKIGKELGWQPRIRLAEGMRDTVQWYRDNRAWINSVRSGEYRNYYEKQYGAAEHRS